MNSTNYDEEDAVNAVVKKRANGSSVSVMNAALPLALSEDKKKAINVDRSRVFKKSNKRLREEVEPSSDNEAVASESSNSLSTRRKRSSKFAETSQPQTHTPNPKQPMEEEQKQVLLRSSYSERIPESQKTEDLVGKPQLRQRKFSDFDPITPSRHVLSNSVVQYQPPPDD